jgi:trans-aconitate 2-methyltransferase
MGSGGTRDWDAGSYERVATPQRTWSEPVIERLGLRGGETVLDAGCGGGAVTEALLARLPRGRVIAVDGSASMVVEARTRLDPERSTVIHADLLELELSDRVDAIFSNAVFHWIHDHAALFARLHGLLAPGGRIEAQYGGRGNVERFMRALRPVAAEPPFKPYLEGFEPVHFAGPEETAELLEAAGFVAVECWLEKRPTRPEEPREFVRSVCLGAHADRLPEELRGELLEAVMDRLGPDPELDYVRLNVSARRA